MDTIDAIRRRLETHLALFNLLARYIDPFEEVAPPRVVIDELLANLIHLREDA